MALCILSSDGTEYFLHKFCSYSSSMFRVEYGVLRTLHRNANFCGEQAQPSPGALRGNECQRVGDPAYSVVLELYFRLSMPWIGA